MKLRTEPLSYVFWGEKANISLKCTQHGFCRSLKSFSRVDQSQCLFTYPRRTQVPVPSHIRKRVDSPRPTSSFCDFRIPVLDIDITYKLIRLYVRVTLLLCTGMNKFP